MFKSGKGNSWSTEVFILIIRLSGTFRIQNLDVVGVPDIKLKFQMIIKLFASNRLSLFPVKDPRNVERNIACIICDTAVECGKQQIMACLGL